VKKHSTQFSNKEHNYLLNRFKSVPRGEWDFNKYSKSKAIKRGVDLQVLNTIWTDGFDIIEYHRHDQTGDNRVLLRSICTDKNDKQVCASFSLDRKQIITVYLNERTNKHFKLDWTEYDKSIDVIATIKSMTPVIK
jgi:uncharacterized DUF497 family protein